MRSWLKGQNATQCAQLLASYSACGFCQDLSELPNGDIPLIFDSPQIETGWDGIMWIVQLMGCFARINRVNCLEFVPIKCEWKYFNEEQTLGTIIAARNIQGKERYSTKFSDDRIHIVGVAMDGDNNKLVTCRSGELPDDANITITLEKNPIFANSGKTTYEILSAILEQLRSAYFYGFQTEIQNDPAFDAGDVIRLQGGVINGTNKNNDLIGFITHSVWRYRGRQTITNVGQVPIIYQDDNANTASVQALNDDGITLLTDVEPLFSVPPKPQSQKALKNLDGTATALVFPPLPNCRLVLTDPNTVALLNNGRTRVKFQSLNDGMLSIILVDYQGNDKSKIHFNQGGITVYNGQNQEAAYLDIDNKYMLINGRKVLTEE